MAKTLLFVEALALAALSLIFPLVASEAAAAFVIPVAVSLILPLACTAAIWPLSRIARSLSLAFSRTEPGREDEALAAGRRARVERQAALGELEAGGGGDRGRVHVVGLEPEARAEADRVRLGGERGLEAWPTLAEERRVMPAESFGSAWPPNLAHCRSLAERPFRLN